MQMVTVHSHDITRERFPVVRVEIFEVFYELVGIQNHKNIWIVIGQVQYFGSERKVKDCKNAIQL